MTLAAVVARRRAERLELLDKARAFASGLDPALGVRGVAVFGSVARGDFNLWSDVDVLVVAEHLPDGFLDRHEAVGDRPPKVQPVLWRPEEFRREAARGNPIAGEAADVGVWLVGSADDLGG